MYLIINFLIYFLIFTNSTLSLSLSRRHGVMSLSYSLFPSRLSLSFLFFFSFFLSFLAFPFGFEVLLILTAGFSSLFLFLFFFLSFHGLLKTPGLAGWERNGWGEGAQAFLFIYFFLKFSYTKIFSPGSVPVLFATRLLQKLFSIVISEKYRPRERL